MARYIFVTGGVVSGIGKGITAASIGRLLKDRGFSVFMQKFDPYLNVDPGTLSPYQHGEVFVTKDGAETDLDLGHYERFIDEELSRDSSITSGRIYQQVIRKERAGDYGGKTVQVIPHVTDLIKEKVYKIGQESDADFIITEIGGTVGDMESEPFFEAIRQVHSEHPDRVMFIHVVLIPTIPLTDELKTKPAQHSFKALMSRGVKPDVFVLRAQEPITEDIFDKISLFCDLPREAIVESRNVDLVYECPLVFKQQGLDDYILRHFQLEAPLDRTGEWKAMCDKFKQAREGIRVALVGKYTKLKDSYLSVDEALYDAGYNLGEKVSVSYFDSEKVNQDNVEELFEGYDGILIPGGFGERGTEGMVAAVRYARRHRLPYLGICLGMQVALIEVARDELGWEDADSVEFNPHTSHPVIHLMEDQEEEGDLGGTLRLGNYPCQLAEGSKARALYGREAIQERHRHRYEFNNAYRRDFQEKSSLRLVGLYPEKDLVEVVEDEKQPFFVGCQFHPEFKSRPNRPHPLFSGFIQAMAAARKDME